MQTTKMLQISDYVTVRIQPHTDSVDSAERKPAMLVLNLKEGDYVMLGDNIKVYFEHKFSRDSLDLLIDAPKDVLIMRDKLYEKSIAGKAVSTDKKVRKPRRMNSG